MQAVILCGGKGLRMREITGSVPKPLVLINGKPLIWHIMKHYSRYGINEFVLPIGYKGDMIKEYFVGYRLKNSDISVNLESGELKLFNLPGEKWEVTLIDTGQETMTGARVKLIENYIKDDVFMLTYGDGLSDIDLNRLLDYHNQKQKIATVTGIRAKSSYGVLTVCDGIAEAFTEKPRLGHIVNGGYFVCNRKIFGYLDQDAACCLEDSPMKRLVEDRQLAVYLHDGYWQSIDTQKDIEAASGYINLLKE